MTESEREPATADGNESPANIREVEMALEGDPTRLGQVWRRREKTPHEIADELEVATPGFVYSYRRTAAALLNGEVPPAPTSAKQVASALRGFVKRHEGKLSDETAEHIQGLAGRCDRVAEDPLAIQREDDLDQEETRKEEAKDTPGIYVYTYPHYRRHPVLPGLEYKGTGSERRPRTYFKVGMSGRDVKERIANQMRGTAVPERRSLLRIYTTPTRSDLKKKEKRLHQHLKAADHGRDRTKDYGTEWFLTHLEFLDDTADLLGLSTAYARLQDDQAEEAEATT